METTCPLSGCIRAQLKPFLPLHLLPWLKFPEEEIPAHPWEPFQMPHSSYMQANRYSGHLNSDLPSFYYNWSLISLIHSWWGSDSARAVVQRDHGGNCRQDPHPALPHANHMPVIKFLSSLGFGSLICKMGVWFTHCFLSASSGRMQGGSPGSMKVQ